MRTKLKIRDSRGKTIASVSESCMTNDGVQNLHYDQTSGAVTIRHRGDMITVSGRVRGDLTVSGNVNPTRIRCGGSLDVTS